jgi:predicted secreted protein
MAVVSNALGSLNDTHGKHIAVLSEAQTFTRAQNVASVALTSTAGSVATNAALGNIFTLTLTENTTLANPTNLVAGGRYVWIVTQGASAYTVALGGTFLATLDTFVMPGGAGDKAILDTTYDGTNLIYTFDVHAASDFVLQNDVFVAKNGVNAPGGGNISSPYGDPFYATTQTTGTITNPHVINLSPGTYQSTSLAIKPFVSYRGTQQANIEANTGFTLDAAWTSAVGASASFHTLDLTGEFSIDFTGTTEVLTLFFNDSIINNPFSMTGTGFQDMEATNVIFGSTVDLKGVTAFIQSCDFDHADVDPGLSILPMDSGSGSTTAYISNSEFNGDILISGAASRVSSVTIKSSAITGTITLNTTDCTLVIDQASYPQAGFLFTGGATSAQIRFTTQFSPEDTAFVTTNGRNTNGNGTFSNPYADPYYATSQITGTPSNQKLIVMYPNEYDTANFAIKPNITYQGFSYATQLDVTNPVTLDASWSSSGIGSFTTLKDLVFTSTLTLDFSAVGAGRGMIIQNCFLGTITFTGADDNIPVILMSNCTFSNDLTIAGTDLEAFSLRFDGSDADITIQSSGSGNTSVDLSACFFHQGTDILISGASGSTTTVIILASPIRGTLTLDTTFATLVIDADSIPSGGITYTNGALSSQVTVVGNAPAKSFNNAYTAQNYTVPVAQNSSTNATAWNLNTAPSAKQTMTENTTLSSPTNQVEGGIYTFKFVQDSTPRTLAFNSVYKFPGAVVPVVSTGSGAVDIFTFYSDGTNMRCIGIAQNIS